MTRGKFSFGFVDSFDAVELTAADKRDYTLFRKKVLRAGRFSAFEAGANQTVAALYTQLCRDPEVVTDITGPYPWTQVRWAKAGAA
jgi:hypothetical protein